MLMTSTSFLSPSPFLLTHFLLRCFSPLSFPLPPSLSPSLPPSLPPSLQGGGEASEDQSGIPGCDEERRVPRAVQPNVPLQTGIAWDEHMVRSLYFTCSRCCMRISLQARSLRPRPAWDELVAEILLVAPWFECIEET